MKASALLPGARGYGSARFSFVTDLPVSTWLKVIAERRRLANLDAALLSDMGISVEAAADEAARPFWDVKRPC